MAFSHQNSIARTNLAVLENLGDLNYYCYWCYYSRRWYDYGTWFSTGIAQNVTMCSPRLAFLPSTPASQNHSRETRYCDSSCLLRTLILFQITMFVCSLSFAFAFWLLFGFRKNVRRPFPFPNEIYSYSLLIVLNNLSSNSSVRTKIDSYWHANERSRHYKVHRNWKIFFFGFLKKQNKKAEEKRGKKAKNKHKPRFVIENIIFQPPVGIGARVIIDCVVFLIHFI